MTFLLFYPQSTLAFSVLDWVVPHAPHRLKGGVQRVELSPVQAPHCSPAAQSSLLTLSLLHLSPFLLVGSKPETVLAIQCWSVPHSILSLPLLPYCVSDSWRGRGPHEGTITGMGSLGAELQQIWL